MIDMKTTLLLIMAAVVVACGSPKKLDTKAFEGSWCSKKYYDKLKESRSINEAIDANTSGMLSFTLANDTVVVGGYFDAERGQLMEVDGKVFYKTVDYDEGQPVPVSIVNDVLMFDTVALVRVNGSVDQLINEQTLAGNYTNEAGETVVFGVDGSVSGLGKYTNYFVYNMPAEENSVIVGTDSRFLQDDSKIFIWGRQGDQLMIYEAIPIEDSMYDERGELKMTLTEN